MAGTKLGSVAVLLGTGKMDLGYVLDKLMIKS